VSYNARATLGDFTGATDSVRGAMTGAGADLAAVRGWVEVPVATLGSGNGKRDRDMRKSMETDRYPTMRFELTGVRVDSARGTTTWAALAGRLTIHGVTREVRLPAQVSGSGAEYRVMSDFTLNVKDYGVGGLSKMLGLLKMNERIVVRVDVVFAVAGATDSSASPMR
jgi:polyisoprenoid-binding protein YceI